MLLLQANARLEARVGELELQAEKALTAKSAVEGSDR